MNAKNKGTADKYVHVSKTAFPELTICPANPYKLNVLQANGINTRNDLRFGSKWISNDTTKSPSDFYNEIVMDVHDIIRAVSIYVEQFIDGENIFKITPNDTVCGDNSLFQPKAYYFNGDCFVTKLPDCIIEAGKKIYIHRYIKF